jgi:hypothetical protein
MVSLRTQYREKGIREGRDLASGVFRPKIDKEFPSRKWGFLRLNANQAENPLGKSESDWWSSRKKVN